MEVRHYKRVIKLNTFTLLFTIFFTLPSFSKEKLIGVFYYNRIFGHILEQRDSNSSSLTTISCGFPLKVYEVNEPKEGWEKVEAAGVKGYTKTGFLSEEKPDCFQGKYPKFFNANELSLTEMYYWGRLYDMYIFGKSRVK